jgi:hypothetical protein
MKWIVISDMQVPFHDPKTISSLYRFIEATQPDGLLVVGDELDSPAPSQWQKGYAGEYSGTLQKEIDDCHGVLQGFRAALGEGPIHLSRSNHGDRIRKYINRYAPALDSLRGLDYSVLLGFAELGITYHRQPFEFAPGWVLAHCDEGPSTQTAGGTALGLAKKWGKSVVGGHTHKAGLQHQHLSLNGKINTQLFGLEVGHLMRFGNGKNSADYLKAGAANWQQATALIEVDGRRVQPTLIPIFNSTVVWNGVTY